MAVCIVIGLRKVSFKSRDGNQIDGVTIYSSHRADGVDGVVAEKLFLSADKLKEAEWDPKVGDEFEPVYKRNSDRVDRVEVI